MKKFTLFLAFIPLFSFAQMTKEEAFKSFKNSNVRKTLGIKIKDFNFEELKEKSLKYNIPLSKMSILNSTNKEVLNSILFDYGRKNAIDESYCTFCKWVIYANIDNYYDSANEISDIED